MYRYVPVQYILCMSFRAVPEGMTSRKCGRRSHSAPWGLLNEFHCVTFGALVVSLYFKTGNRGQRRATFCQLSEVWFFLFDLWKDENYCGKRVTLAGNKNRCSDFPIMWDFWCIQRKHWMIQFRSDTWAPLAIAQISLQVVMLTQMHRTFYTDHDARHYSRLTALWLVHNYTEERCQSWSCKCCRLTWRGINTFPYNSEKQCVHIMLKHQLKHHYADMFDLARSELPLLIVSCPPRISLNHPRPYHGSSMISGYIWDMVGVRSSWCVMFHLRRGACKIRLLYTWLHSLRVETNSTV